MRVSLIILITLLASTFSLMAQSELSHNKTLSPYFLVEGDSKAVEQFPLKSTKANVKIVGPIADVTVTQTYKNDGLKPIEAIYVFPGSTKAAIYGMTISYGENILVAEIEEKNKAKQIYETAKAAGKQTALLEQKRSNVFQMNVANILPGQQVKVVLSYTEFINPENKEYEFVYPTVVGPRFVDPSAKSDDTDSFTSNPYLKSGKDTPYTFDITTQIHMAIPIQDIHCPSHTAQATFYDEKHASVELTEKKNAGNRDYILKYRLSGNQVQSGTMVFEGEDENYFLTMIEPPAKIKTSEIPPREYIFIVDISGSMGGFPLDISKTLMRDLLSHLRPYDMFNIMLFAGASQVLAPVSIEATESNINEAINLIDNQRGGGSTMLLPALERALKMGDCGRHMSKSIIVVTDGYVHIEEEAFRLVDQNLGNANLFAFGIGSSVNRQLIEGLAFMGGGEPFVITEPKHASSHADKFRRYIQSPLLTGIDIRFKGMKTYDLIHSSIPDVMADRPICVFGKYKGNPDAKIILTGYTGNGEYRKEMDFEDFYVNENTSSLRYLWAREKIKQLTFLNYSKKSKKRVKEITSLGLDYNLLTDYTSFVAVDQAPVLKNGLETKKVKQPLPMPAGVPNAAIGFEMALSNTVSVNNTNQKVSIIILNPSMDENLRSRIVTEIKRSFFASGDKLSQHIGKSITFGLNPNGTFYIKDGSSSMSRILKSMLIVHLNGIADLTSFLTKEDLVIELK